MGTESPLALLLIALIPPLFFLVYIYRQDDIESEPRGMIAGIIGLGALSAIPAVILESIGIGFLSRLGLPEDSIIFLLLENFLVVGISEEICKYWGGRLTTWKSPEFNYRFDGIVYMISSAIGFAALENVLYVFEYGFHTGVMRAILSIPLHTICGMFLGYYYGEGKYLLMHGDKDGSRKAFWKGLFIAVAIHGAYDFLASVSSLVGLVLFVVLVIVVDIVAYRFMKNAEKADSPIYE